MVQEIAVEPERGVSVIATAISTAPIVLSILVTAFFQWKATKKVAVKAEEVAEKTHEVAAKLELRDEKVSTQLNSMEETSKITHQIVNSQKTAMEKAIQDLRLEVQRLKGEKGGAMIAGEMPGSDMPKGDQEV